ncbi:unnamed protein product [Nippostrongylus brasiliensis]|uniref:CHCH domain-containing protein n=1 Tax=Nippostrongylus brasiliensis TaxID=27835 RepID=A0A0N4YL21_NIPBR|nr:unnamed protein product [Nippostrongylus brasiliensis]
MRAVVALSVAFVACVAERPKIKDSTGALLVKISDIPVGSCGSDSYFGLGMMNGSLEECERWQLTDPAAMREYEEYKCKHLRGFVDCALEAKTRPRDALVRFGH